jgi:transcription antitermination factor NusG
MMLATKEAPREMIAGVRWHLTYILRNVEGVRTVLKNEGFRDYYPMVTEMKPVARRLLSKKQRLYQGQIMMPKLRPLFPSYLMVEFDATQRSWSMIFRTIGVTGIYCDGGLPKPLPDGFVEGFKALEVDGAIQGSTPLSALPIAVGERGRITDGPFEGHEGICVEELDESGAVKLLVDFLGSPRPMTFEADQVVKA